MPTLVDSVRTAVGGSNCLSGFVLVNSNSRRHNKGGDIQGQRVLVRGRIACSCGFSHRRPSAGVCASVLTSVNSAIPAQVVGRGSIYSRPHLNYR